MDTRQKKTMNCEYGDGVTQRQPPQAPYQLKAQQQASNQRHAQRSTTPAKPKDSFAASLAKIKASSSAPNLSGKAGDPSRLPPRTQGNGRDLRPEKGKQSGKAIAPIAGSQTRRRKLSGLRKLSEPSNASDELTKDVGCTPDKLSPSDSSSELSDCTSEENKFTTTSCETEFRSRGAGANQGRTEDAHGNRLPDRDGRVDQYVNMSMGKDITVSLELETGQESLSPTDERSFASSDSRLNLRESITLSDLQEEFIHGMQEEFFRETEELRSENSYLKDELEELQAEMLEMRDEYLEEDMYQLQVLRQQLDQANKSCRILQYRLRKAERRSLRVAQTGRVDGELICTLEQDLKVAKDVSIRLHGELEAVERKRAELEQENTDLRERLQELEVARLVLQAEMDKTRENSLKRKGSRSPFKSEKKLLPQEDSADLRCQLHFAKEESTLMCRKLAKLARESEGMAEELARFRSLYGRVEGQAASGHTHEAEVRVHLRLVEEEANLLSRRIVELEVENRGLRAEMEEMKYPELPEVVGQQGGVRGKPRVGETEQQNTTLAGEVSHGRVGPDLRAEAETLPSGAGNRVIQYENHVLLCHVDSRVLSHSGPLEECGDEGRAGHAHLAHRGLSLWMLGYYPALLKIRDQACLLNSAICLLTASDSTHLPSPICHMTSPESPSPRSPIEQGILDKSQTKVDILAHGLQNLHVQLQAFMEGVEVLEKFKGVEVQAGDPLPSPVDVQNGENSVGLKGRHNQDQSEWQVTGQAEKEDGQVCDEGVAMCTQSREEPDTAEPPLQDQKGCWVDLPRWDLLPQGRGLQTLRQHNLCSQDGLRLLSLQLRRFLNYWRHGNGLELEQRVQDFLKVNSVKSLYLLMEEEGPAGHQGDSSSPLIVEDPLPLENHKHTLPLENHIEVGGMNCTLLELKGLLQELTAEMLVERCVSRDLAHKFTGAKSAWEAERTELVSQLNQSLHGERSEKDTYTGGEAKGTDLHRIKPITSCSSELQCPLHPSSIHRGKAAGPRGQSGLERGCRYQERADACKTWDGPARTSSFPGLDVTSGEARRSHTAPERTGLRLYFSPPAMRRTHRREQGPRPLPASNNSGSWLPLEANLSDDMKERTHCVRRALERRWADAACQTVGGAGTVGVASVALQTEEGPAYARPPRRHLSVSLERVPGQPRCRSPKLQRRVSTHSSLPLSTSSSTLSSSYASFSTSSSTSSFTSFSSAAPRLEGTTSAPLWRTTRGQNGSAWARSTTPRARSLLASRGPGVVERGGAVDQLEEEPAAGRGVGGKPGVGTGPVHKYGIVQEFLRSVCGRGQVPASSGRGRGGSNVRGKTERAAPRVAVPAGRDSVTCIVNKRFMRHSLREEPGRGGRALSAREKSRSNNALEDTACDCTSRSLTFCFARPPRSGMPHAPGQCRLCSGESCQSPQGKGQPADE